MQNEGKLPVCHLCLKSLECTYEYIEAPTIETLRFLGLELYLDQSGKSVKPIVCKTCSESVQKCYDFKTICICSEDCISSFRNEGNDVKLDLREIYLRKNGIKNTAVSKYHTICRLCMEMVESSSCTPLSKETGDVISAEAILRRCLSELNLDVTANPHVCASCNDTLHSYFTLVKNCLGVKDEVKNSCKIEESNDENQVESDNELRFGAENVSNYKNRCPELDIVKSCDKNELCNGTEMNIENILKKESQEWQIKPEINESEENDDAIRDIAERTTDISYNNINNIKHEEITIKTEEEDIDGCQNNTLTRKNSLKVPMHYCEICGYKTKWKSGIKKHMLVHKNISEVTMYSCEICAFISIHKRSFTQHMLNHKNASEVTMYPCEVCAYKAKRKSYLHQHKLIHKNASEITAYSCKICTYKSKYRGTLKRHLLTHTNASEVTRYSCSMCTFKSKYKSSLATHMFVHKNVSAVTMYSCEMCTYKSEDRGNLNRHMLTHKNASEVKIYSCSICTFKSKHKISLTKHTLIHKNVSVVTVYSCEKCTYKSEDRGILNRHMLTHKNASEVTRYSCSKCKFKSKHKLSLKRHMLNHKNTSKVTM